jgi:hypothetical protein
MNVIRHEAVRVHRAAMLNGEFSQLSEVHQAVGVRQKARGSIHAALNQMRGNAWVEHP